MKLLQFFNYVVKHFQILYYPEKNLAIDESLLLRKGRLPFVQFIRIKRT